MKKSHLRWFKSGLVCLALFAFTTCKNDAPDPPAMTDTDFWGAETTVSVSGQVRDESGNPVGGAAVKVGSQQTTTDANGVFVLANAKGLKSLGYVQVEKAGYFPGSRSFLPAQQGNRIRITLLEKTIVGNIPAAKGGKVIQANGVELSLPPGSVLKNGVAYNGMVKVALKYIDPTKPGFEDEMPGNLLGIADNQARGLASYGMIGAELLDDGNNKVELASGKTARLVFPVPASLQASAPASIDLWSFDEARGYWVKEGQARLEGKNYVAEVGHFSFWNCDVPFRFISLSGQVKVSVNQQPLHGARVTVTSTNMGSAYDITNGAGEFGGFVPRGETLTLKVAVQCDPSDVYTEVHSQQIGPFAENALLNPISVAIPQATLVTGVVQDCNNNPLAGSYVGANGKVYFTNSTGAFSFLGCGTSLEVTAYGSNPWTKGTSQTLTLPGNGSIDPITLTVCSTSPAQTVSDIDGNVYNTVTIGTQTWLRENLKTSRYRDGSPILTGLSDSAWEFATTGAYAYLDNFSGSDAIFGKLYNWYAVADPRQLCPAGWHVPNDAEWTILENYLGGDSIAGGKMKAVSNLWQSPNIGATNESGFSGLPGNMRNFNGTFSDYIYSGSWLSSSQEPNHPGYTRTQVLLSSDGHLHRFSYSTRNGSSVRCLRDQ